MAGLRVTLVSRGFDTPYSGMLPGVVAGAYSRDEAHIDLIRLCRHSGVRFVMADAVGVDPDAQRLLLADRPALPYDVLSLDIGSTPAPVEISRDAAHAVIFTKPIDGFLQKWERLRARAGNPDRRLRVAIVGGGAAGVELALAIERSLRADRSVDGRLEVELLTAGRHILESHPKGVRTRLMRCLSERGISVRNAMRVDSVVGEESHPVSRVLLNVGGEGAIVADAVIWATQASPAAWLAESTLATDVHGFVSVNEYLQSVSHANVFAAGDVASSVSHPRPKAGVFAVRQGKPLARNLRRYLTRRPLQRFVPQRRFLTLIGTADGQAVASRGPWAAHGRWAWRWKDHIDRKFMRRFTVADRRSDARVPPPSMPRPDPAILAVDDARALAGPHADGMRCAGCGSKAAADVLSRALGRLHIPEDPRVLSGIGSRDDAAIVRVPQDRSLVLSVDAFRALVDDPFVFGQITANHCLNDLYAMGAQPMSALAQVTLPAWPADKLAEELYQMLAGALDVLGPAGASLVGGHTGEGGEITLGFTVTGTVDEQRVFAKAGHRIGDRIVVTKALGTGCLFAADMRAQAHAASIAAAIETMRLSNKAAVECLAEHDAHAVTDITGFGLAGHLGEMLRDAATCAHLWLERLPLIPGTLDALARGWVSSLHDSNRRWVEAKIDDAQVRGERDFAALRAVLFDPQTAGPLLACVPQDRASACVAALRARGYADACEVGEIREVAASEPIQIRLIFDR
jgi:selenide,water dikinase